MKKIDKGKMAIDISKLWVYYKKQQVKKENSMNGKSRRRFRPKRAGGGGRPVPRLPLNGPGRSYANFEVAEDGKSAVKRTGYRMFFIPYLEREGFALGGSACRRHFFLRKKCLF